MVQRIRQLQTEREGGFTLIELLIVIIVLGILAGIVVFGVSTFRSDATTTACKASLKTVNVAADAYNAKVGNYPSAITDLTGGGYLKSAPTNVGTLTFDTTGLNVTSSACTLP